jgi:hypothetical protein
LNAELLRNEELAFELAQMCFYYLLTLEIQNQLQASYFKDRRRGRPRPAFGRFAADADQILSPLPRPTRLRLIAAFGRDFFDEDTTIRRLRDRLNRGRRPARHATPRVD